MVDAQADALPANRRCIAIYLNSYVIDGIKRLVRSLAELGSEDSDLDLAQLITQHRKTQEETLADKLNIVKYEIDSKDSIKLFGSGRIENFLLPLLYLVIRRHLQFMKLASTVILVERELESATQTLENILEGVSLRVDQLAGAVPSYLMMSYLLPPLQNHFVSRAMIQKQDSRGMRMACTTFGTVQN
jgi:hypothetical protein